MATQTRRQTTNRYRNVPPYTMLVAVAAVSVIGTYLSTSLYSSSTLSFRSRLPASALSTLSSTSSLPLTALPYFADKRNLFNRWFVKYAWAWSTSFALAHILARELFPAQPDGTPTSAERIVVDTTNDDRGSKGDTAAKRVLVDALRWSTATFYWYFLTQRTWFFGTGPSITHRLLVATGAQCVPHSLASTSDESPSGPMTPRLDDERTPNPLSGTEMMPSSSSTTCGHGMYYAGGHDVSGHTFLLVLSTLLLWETVRSSARQFTSGRYALPLPHFVTMAASIVLIALWIGMLAATSLFFHSPSEKMSGLAFGLAAWWASRGGRTGW